MDNHPPGQSGEAAAGDFWPSASLSSLQRRAALLGRLRQFFAARGFWEVDTPLLSADIVVDRHLDPLPVTLFGHPARPDHGRRMWLQTSPEFCMKRLLAAGARSIYQVTHAFRGGESGRWHNPEFTIVEWYRVGDSMAQGMELLSQLSVELLGRGAAETISYAQAFQQFLGFDPHAASVAEMAAAACAHEVAVPDQIHSEDRDEWLNLLLATCVEPHLGRGRPAMLYHYPASQSALAQVVQHASHAVAERFELYVDGIELANGYHELLDADVLRRRNAEANRQRVADGKYALPEDSRLLAAMEHGLPPCTGVALGLDRLVMLATSSDSLAEVLAFPIDRA